ncbi:type I-G CRISPR-associated protein, Cas3-extension family [Alicyclobacillus acidocaldarius]|uniref:Uncharacterized protein n=1 Tax=Alicyclobacillus acidocaldarius (strain Tc-4-1) TaxID=1048834 RepID=F8IDR8_ALIAT|nr:hypothetical protein [Alicyclobacillus acidocaldarius]AEJ45111.1 hypothetical protein TC41_3232 [Alicyclobacillus acidocaldarius subsp. acidocaldarius Tc-4-1]
MTAHEFRLEGLEPDNPLAFFALLGLLRALEAVDLDCEPSERLYPRVQWAPAPLRPVLVVRRSATEDEIAKRAVDGIAQLANHHDFGDHADLNYTQQEAREILSEAIAKAGPHQRYRADLLAALMSDGAVEGKRSKKSESPRIAPTPVCLLFGQGHQHFLKRLRDVPRSRTPDELEDKGRVGAGEEPEQYVQETIFRPWRRDDTMLSSFRWDPNEIARYALMPGNPTDPKYKLGTQYGANRLAAIGISVLSGAPRNRADRTWLTIVGGHYDKDGFTLAWPIWRAPATLAAIRFMLAHPGLRDGGLRHMGVEQVMVSRRIQIEKYFSFTRAQPRFVEAT